MPKAAVLMKTPAVGAQLWHKRTMEPELDLKQASRETLPAVIASNVESSRNSRTPLPKWGRGPGSPAVRRRPGGRDACRQPAARRKKLAEQEKKPRKKRPHDFARLRMEPARRVVHAPESCPECHTTLSGGWVQRTREVIDIPVVPAEVTEHVFIARTCPLAGNGGCPRTLCKVWPWAASGWESIWSV